MLPFVPTDFDEVVPTPRTLSDLIHMAGGVALVAQVALVSRDTVERAARGAQNPTMHTLLRIRHACERLTGASFSAERVMALWAVGVDDRRRRAALRRLGEEARRRA